MTQNVKSVMNAYETLGLKWGATQDEVRAAYHALAKNYHPDHCTERGKQDAAQEQMIRLNLAYEEAMRTASQRRVVQNTGLSLEESKRLAVKMGGMKRWESALRYLERAECKDAEWYYLRGNAQMNLKEWGEAHRSFREAVRLEPDNLTYRRGAFDAACAVKKHNKPLRRCADALGALLGGRKK